MTLESRLAAFSLGGWLARRGETTLARYSRGSGAAILFGFIGGAALATQSLGILPLWRPS